MIHIIIGFSCLVLLNFPAAAQDDLTSVNSSGAGVSPPAAGVGSAFDLSPPPGDSEDVDIGAAETTEQGSVAGEPGLGEGEEFPHRSTILLKVSDIPPKSIKLFGKRENISDAFGNTIRVAKYLGVPFALPPVENFRYQRPTLKILQEDFEAMTDPVACPQLDTNGQLVGDEDCLLLNVHCPDTTTAEGEEPLSRLPVLVWFHGESVEKLAVNQDLLGILSSGSAAELDPDIFLINKVIVVTPQYRLGSLGFLSTVNEDLSGNMGIFDQLLALEWVQRYIRFFGGDPQQVTLLGHGGSAMSLGLLTTSELARGFFHRVILMSGSPLSPISLDTVPKATFAEIALQNSCPSFPTLRFVRCMQQKKVSEVIEADARVKENKNLGSVKIPLPLIQRNADGRFLPPILNTVPKTAFTTGNFEQVPLLIGVTAAEMAGFLPSISGKPAREIRDSIFASETSLKQFIRMVVSRSISDPTLASELVTFEYFSGLNVTQRMDQAMDLLDEVMSDFLFHIPAISFAKLWSRFAPVYFYVFDHLMDAGDELGRQLVSGSNQASHGTDLNFLTSGQKGNAGDRQISEAMLEFWVNFIYKGSPLNAGVDWPQFREDNQLHIVFRDRIEVGKSFRFRQNFLWSDLLDMMISNDRKCPRRRTNSGSKKSVITFRDPDDFLKYTAAEAGT